MKLVLRSNTYHIVRRVPTRYASVEPRTKVSISLHTDSRSVAQTKATTVWNQMIEAWEARLAGDTDDAEVRYDAARELAAVRGFRYLNQKQVSELPLEAILDRVEAISAPNGVPNLIEAAALLGTVPEPELTVRKALELYWTLARDKTLNKSDDQRRRWRNPRIKAIDNFADVVGDKPIDRITRDDMLDFREYWQERIEKEELTPNSANKDLIHLSEVLKTVNSMKRLNIDLPLGGLSFKEGERPNRPPFSTAWIRDRLLCRGALDGLNDEARALLLGMVNTGYRPSEGAALTAQTIRLDTTVPHISIEPDGRQLKSQNARRIIPLTGVSLAAFQEFPDGFPRYRNNPSLSATVNKYLRENGLLESERHSMYSLRHAFEDRMLEAGVDERVRRDLLGHRLDRERYGKGASLEKALELLKPVAL